MTARLRPPALRVAAIVAVTVVHAAAFGGLSELAGDASAPPARFAVGVVARGEIAFEARALPVPDRIEVPQQAETAAAAAPDPQPAASPAVDPIPPVSSRNEEQPREATKTVIERTAQAPPVAAPPAAASAQKLGSEEAKAQDQHAAEARYAALVSAAVNSRKYFPPGARSRGAHGSVAVSFRVDRTGHVTGPAIARSSGNKLLDATALRMVTSATLPRPPGESFSGIIEIRFRFRE